MSRILFAWELGANFGHIGKFRSLARKLREAGHDVRFALRDVTSARSFLGKEGFPCYQAPMWAPKPRPKDKAFRSYADILEQVGWNDAPALGGIIHAWRGLYDLVRPDILVASHAPTALLAATGMPLHKVRLGTGFDCPPLTAPLPPLQYWAPASPDELLATETIIVESVQQVLREFGQRPSARFLRDLIAPDDDLLCTFPELDHYPGRRSSAYFGALFTDDQGSEPEWPAGSGKPVFTYLRSSYASLPFVLQELRKSGRPVLAVVPGSQYADQDSRATVRIVGEPVRLASVAAHAGLYVSHGGHGAVAAMLLAGVPVLAFPNHMEQYMLARRLHESRTGILVEKPAAAEQAATGIREALQAGQSLGGVQKFQAAHAGFRRDKQLEDICSAITTRRSRRATGEQPEASVSS